MSFLSPIWLIGLIPWLALVYWMLRDRPMVAMVPFAPLWPKGAATSSRRATRLPSISVMAILAAALLGILAAANPRVGSTEKSSNGYIAIVDRGLTMSAVNARGQRRFAEAADLGTSVIGDASITWQAVPKSDAISPGDYTPTAVVDVDAIKLAVREALGSSQATVLVLSDQNLNLDDPRVIQIPPQTLVTNVGIDRFTVRAGAHPQAMVTIFNQSDQSSATLFCQCGLQKISQDIDLPPRAQKKNYFIDLPAADNDVQVQVVANDNLDLNHTAWALRGATWPRLEARATLPPELQRMIEVYSHDRPAESGSQTVVITTSADSDLPNVPTAILGQGSARVDPGNPIQIADSSLSASVDWQVTLANATISPPPTGDWKPIVSSGDLVVLAVQETPVKRVWVGFHSDEFARKPSFVIFWSYVFQWLSPGTLEFQSRGIGRLEGDWQLQQTGFPQQHFKDAGLVPGIYRSSGFPTVAVNASAPVIPTPPKTDWRAKLGESVSVHGSRGIANMLLLAALAAICLAAATWRTVPKS